MGGGRIYFLFFKGSWRFKTQTIGGGGADELGEIFRAASGTLGLIAPYIFCDKKCE